MENLQALVRKRERRWRAKLKEERRRERERKCQEKCKIVVVACRLTHKRKGYINMLVEWSDFCVHLSAMYMYPVTHV